MTSFHHNLYNLTMLGEELYKYLCFRSYPIICINSLFVCCILKYEINMFKSNGIQPYAFAGQLHTTYTS